MNKKILIFLLTICIAGIGVCSCAKQKTDEPAVDTASEAGEKTIAWEKYAVEPVTLDWYINYSWFNTDWGENVVSQKITEETGVSINFITPSGNETEKLNALIAANSLPDLITLGWWEAQINEMIDKDMVFALNELADQYDMYFWKVSDPDVVNWFTREDGNIYCYPNSSYTVKDLNEHDNISSNQTFLVRKDIYEAIGSPDMTTPDGFQKAVEDAKRMFPTVDGEPLIPIGAHTFTDQGNNSFDTYLMNFLAVPFEKDGKMYDRYTDPDYIEWLKMFRQLGEEGLLTNDIFIDQRTQMEEKLAEGRYFCMLYQYIDMATQQKKLYAEDPDKIYIAVDGPRNANGDDHTLTINGINGWTVTMISKNCEHPERAIAFMDYLLSEQGQKLLYLGVEGETYDMVDGTPVVKEEVQEMLNTDRASYDSIYGADNAYWMLQDNVMQLKWKQKAAEPLVQPEEWTFPYVIYNGQYDCILPAESEEAHADLKITQLWSETLPKLLLAKSEEDFDSLFKDFIKKRDSYGYDAVMDMKTKLMQQTKKEMGIE